MLQNTDKRVIFVNPYEGEYALIGTTDIAYDGEASKVAIGEDEIDYLLAVLNRYFKHTLDRSDIVESFSGVRPLYDDDAENPSAVTRDYVFDLDDEAGAPLLSIFGGKITTFRKLAEHALERLRPHFPNMSASWTAQSSLPGGDMQDGDFDVFRYGCSLRYPWLDERLLDHYARLYGTRIDQLLADCQDRKDLGRHFGGRLYERELDYLLEHEWAKSCDDVLLRRTKHGLHLSQQEKAQLEEWFAKRFGDG